MKIIEILMLVLISAGIVAASPGQVKKWQCPMKCETEKIYDKPGKCPVCGMALKEIKEGEMVMPTGHSSANGELNHSLKVIGEMRNVMMKGELWGMINLDTIKNREHLYGFGPVEYQKGEIIIIDGKSYKSTITKDDKINVSPTYAMKASFFAYENISNWEQVKIPDSVTTMSQLENYLGEISMKRPRPFFFRLNVVTDSAEIHIVNLPEGKKVLVPADAHTGQQNFEVNNEKVEMLGFFSTEHKRIFTHHDSNIHIHLITADKKKMGHLETLQFQRGTAQLWLPVTR